MELALSALASMGAAGGTAAAGAGGLSAVLGSSPVLGILSGAASAVSVLQTLHAGELQAQHAEYQAATARNEAIGEQAAGTSRAARFKRELMKTLGENEVAYAAAGIDISVGAPADRAGRTRDEAYEEITLDRAATDARVAGLQARGHAYDQLARGYRTGALWTALGKGLQLGTLTMRRG